MLELELLLLLRLLEDDWLDAEKPSDELDDDSEISVDDDDCDDCDVPGALSTDDELDNWVDELDELELLELWLDLLDADE